MHDDKRKQADGPGSPSSSEPPRDDLERRVLATLLRGREWLPRVVHRLDPAHFADSHVARVVEALVASYEAEECLKLDDLRSRLSDKDRRQVEMAIQYGMMLGSEAQLVAALDRLAREPAARAAAPKPARVREAKPAPEAKPAAAAFYLPLKEFPAEPPEWLWPGHVELGQLTLVGGEPGSGKSLLACDLAARITAGRPWPDGAAACQPASVLLVASGDEVSGLMRPRLEAAGADVDRVHVLPIGSELYCFKPQDPKRGSLFRDVMKSIEEALAAISDCRMVVIDPLRLCIGRTDTTIGGDPAARLESLARFARRERVTLLGVAATLYEDRRRNNLADALKLATGACDATAWQVVRHPHRRSIRLFLPAKTARSSDLEGLAFSVAEEPSGERVRWEEQPVPADGLEATPRDDAAGWLRQALADGRLASKDLFELGQRNGYTPRMLHRAKPVAGVTVIREGFGPGAAWHWLLAGSNGAPQAKIA
ncbi:MAG TPA: AAA family ATPase [Pirellulales bacterium]|nr:AAA family ATPase [Pirellulales bacterium]